MVREIMQNSKLDIYRNNFKWNINELLRLEREYDLLELNVVEIAKLHQRTATAIAMKLQSECIISNYKVARGYIVSCSDSDTNSNTRKFSVLYDDNEDSDTSSEYIPSESEYGSDSDSDSDYSPEYYKSYAKKYIQYKNNNTQSDLDSDSDSEYVKNELAFKSDTNYDSDSDSDSSVEIIENNNVTQRVDKLESSVSNMEGMLTKLYNFMTSHSSSLNMGYDM